MIGAKERRPSAERPSDRRSSARTLGVASALVVVVHGALFASLARSSAAAGPAGEGAGYVSMRVRTVAPTAPTVAETPEPPPDAGPTASRRPASPPTTSGGARSAGGAAREPRAPRSPVALKAGLASRSDAPASAGDDYFDAALLSIRPRAVTEIHLPEPETNGFAGTLGATLVLYISREGAVSRIDIEESSLPPDFEVTTREAFEGAVFSPGRIDGRAVNSRLRIDVTFDGGSSAR